MANTILKTGDQVIVNMDEFLSTILTVDENNIKTMSNERGVTVENVRDITKMRNKTFEGDSIEDLIFMANKVKRVWHNNYSDMFTINGRVTYPENGFSSYDRNFLDKLRSTTGKYIMDLVETNSGNTSCKIFKGGEVHIRDRYSYISSEPLLFEASYTSGSMMHENGSDTYFVYATEQELTKAFKKLLDLK